MIYSTVFENVSFAANLMTFTKVQFYNRILNQVAAEVGGSSFVLVSSRMTWGWSASQAGTAADT